MSKNNQTLNTVKPQPQPQPQPQSQSEPKSEPKPENLIPFFDVIDDGFKKFNLHF